MAAAWRCGCSRPDAGDALGIRRSRPVPVITKTVNTSRYGSAFCCLGGCRTAWSAGPAALPWYEGDAQRENQGRMRRIPDRPPAAPRRDRSAASSPNGCCGEAPTPARTPTSRRRVPSSGDTTLECASTKDADEDRDGSQAAQRRRPVATAVRFRIVVTDMGCTRALARPPSAPPPPPGPDGARTGHRWGFACLPPKGASLWPVCSNCRTFSWRDIERAGLRDLTAREYPPAGMTTPYRPGLTSSNPVRGSRFFETGRSRKIPNVLQNRGTVPPFKGVPRSNVCNIFPVDLGRFGILPHAHLTLGSVQHFSGCFLSRGRGGGVLVIGIEHKSSVRHVRSIPGLIWPKIWYQKAPIQG